LLGGYHDPKLVIMGSSTSSRRRDRYILFYFLLAFLFLGLHRLISLQHLLCLITVAVGLVGARQLVVQRTVLIARQGSLEVWDGFRYLSHLQVGEPQRTLCREELGIGGYSLLQISDGFLRLLRVPHYVTQ